MPSPDTLRLYVRLGCHLCEDAAQQLTQAGIAFVRVDIDRDEALRDEYDTLVPVLHDRAQDREWHYPFVLQNIIESGYAPSRPDSH